MLGMSGMAGSGCSPGIVGSVRPEVNDTSPGSSSLRALNRLDVVSPIGVEVDIPEEVAIWDDPVMVSLSPPPPFLVLFAFPAFPLFVIGSRF